MPHRAPKPPETHGIGLDRFLYERRVDDPPLHTLVKATSPEGAPQFIKLWANTRHQLRDMQRHGHFVRQVALAMANSQNGQEGQLNAPRRV